MKDIVKIQNELEMLGFLKSNGTQCRFVSLISNTPVVKIKAGAPWKKGELRKVSKKLGIINANYNTSVRTRIAAKLGISSNDVEYVNGETWFAHFKTEDNKSLPVGYNKNKPDNGETYIQYFPHSSENKYVDGTGNIVLDEQVEPFLYAENNRPDFKPVIININLKNIKELRASGIIMQADDIDEAKAILQID